tara:strand:- start:1192 stop:1578 length:387 start_codon:yes stop_codon:yes gene_type:complete
MVIYKMSANAVKIIQDFDGTSKQSKLFMKRLTGITNRYKQSGINKDTIFPLVSTIMLEVQQLKTLRGPDKRALVIEVVNSVISEIDEGETDTEFERNLKMLVPPAIDSLALMLKTSAGCKKLFPCLGK